ncbi:MAG TPA: TonB-dependent receptor plug domain-containing protein [Bacteroidales bacterium]|nr:TonB-dependent receptor plug domain-containing protein [Bacteroidales bacterium]
MRDRTTASAKVDMSQLRNVIGLSVDNALQGQVTGLDIMSTGAPGSGSSIIIRGIGSLGNSKPLIVIDGITQDIKIGSDFDLASSNQDDIGALLNIAPQDIKSIEVLKDATSTAVWGSKGADGVLLIETNRGSKGKTSFNYQYKLTIQKQPPPIPMLNGDEYITMQLEELHNASGIFVVPDEIAYNTDYIDFYNYSANTDWIKEITRPGINNDHYFKMSGGGEKTTFFTSLNYSKELGTTLNEGFKRLSTRINLDYTLSKNLRFSVNFNYTNSYKDANYVFKGAATSNIRAMAYLKAPNMSVFKHDQYGNRTNEYFNPINSYQGSGIQYFNPVGIANLSENDESSDILQNSFVFNYKMNKWINFTETISFQYSNVKKNLFLPYTAVGADWLDSRINSSQEGNSVNDRLSARSQLILTPIVNPTHSLITTLLYEISQNSGEWTQINGKNGPSLDIIDPAAGQPIASLSSGSSKLRA